MSTPKQRQPLLRLAAALALPLALLLLCSTCPVTSSSPYPAKFIQVPQIMQAADYTCGVASTLSLINFWTGEFWLQDDLAVVLNATEEDGTNVASIVAFAENDGYEVETYTGLQLQDLHDYIDQGLPVLILIQAWPEQPVKNWTNDWQDGHYVVVIGYDDRNMYMMDPSTIGDFASVQNQEFLDRWHDEDGPTNQKLIHFGLIMRIPGEKPTYNPYAISYMD